jgi:hypothetical protein
VAELAGDHHYLVLPDGADSIRLPSSLKNCLFPPELLFGIFLFCFEIFDPFFQVFDLQPQIIDLADQNWIALKVVAVIFGRELLQCSEKSILIGMTTPISLPFSFATSGSLTSLDQCQVTPGPANVR